jgi:hypothetical protein
MTYSVTEHKFDGSLDSNFTLVKSRVWQQHNGGLDNLNWSIVQLLFLSFGLLVTLVLFNLNLGHGKVLWYSHDCRMLNDHAIFGVDCFQSVKILLKQNKRIVQSRLFGIHL